MMNMKNVSHPLCEFLMGFFVDTLEKQAAQFDQLTQRRTFSWILMSISHLSTRNSKMWRSLLSSWHEKCAKFVVCFSVNFFFLLVIFGENKYGSLMRLQDAGRRVNKPRPTMCCCVAFFLAWLSPQISENFCCLCMLRQESQNPTNGEMKMRDSKSYTSHDSQIYTLERDSTARVFLRFHKKIHSLRPRVRPFKT